jgi:NAD(P)-dependent dehydrogenase (short-subunit alcohol dehydrogenase family)
MPDTTSPKVWLITGASRGLGRLWAEAALARGDRVAATARDAGAVADLAARFGDAVLPLALDVTNGAQVKDAVAQAHARFGRLDVVLNNAGYSLVGTIEEVADEEVRAIFEANVFGTIRVIQAALPVLRAQGHGHILGVSSSVGLVPFPLIGTYCATKAAVESLHESLAAEVRGFGIKVTLIEPGAYATEFGTPASLKMAQGLEAYGDLRAGMRARLAGAVRGDPRATAGAILAVVDAPEPPLRLILGDQTLPQVRAAFAERLSIWEAWADVSNAAQGAPTVHAAAR